MSLASLTNLTWDPRSSATPDASDAARKRLRRPGGSAHPVRVESNGVRESGRFCPDGEHAVGRRTGNHASEKRVAGDRSVMADASHGPVARRRLSRTFGHESIRVAGSIAAGRNTVKLGKNRGRGRAAALSHVRVTG